jgi:hypothetical protein
LPLTNVIGRDLSRFLDDIAAGRISFTKQPGVGSALASVKIDSVSVLTAGQYFLACIDTADVILLGRENFMDQVNRPAIQLGDGSIIGGGTDSLAFASNHPQVDFQQKGVGSTLFRIFNNLAGGGTTGFAQCALFSNAKGQAQSLAFAFTVIFQSGAWWVQIGTAQAANIDMYTISGNDFRFRTGIVLASVDAVSGTNNKLMVRLTNRTGANSIVGDVVSIDTANVDSYVLSTVARRQVGIVAQVVGNTVVGNVAVAGVSNIKVNGAVAIADTIVGSGAVAGEAVVNNAPGAGIKVLGTALASKGAGVGLVRCLLQPNLT